MSCAPIKTGQQDVPTTTDDTNAIDHLVILEAIPHPLVLLDTDNNVEFVNPAADRAL